MKYKKKILLDMVLEMPLVPSLRKKKQADLPKSEANLVYVVSSRPARAVQ